MTPPASRLRRLPDWRRRAAVFLAICALTFATAGPGLQAQVFEPKTFTLDNGMQVALIENHRAPVVTHMVWYKVGSADEGPGESGIAHLLEHLMFKGTKNHEPGEFSRMIARNGGRENAFTSYDYTAYYQTIASDRLEMVMRMEADRMTNLIVTPDSVAPERQVVLEERRSRIENNPAAVLSEQVNAALYLNYPYRRPVIGWEHEIEALDAETIRAFYEKWYAPNNAVLVVEGDVTLERLKPLAEKYYGAIPATPGIARKRTEEPPQRAARTIAMEDARVTQPRWSRTWLAPSQGWENPELTHALEVLSEILGGGSTSRLYRALVIEEQLAISAGSYYGGGDIGPGTFGVYVTPRPGVDMQNAADRTVAEVRRLLRDGIDAQELAEAKKRMRYQAIYARDDFGTGARVIGKALATGQTIEDVESWPDDIGDVTVEQVMQAAETVFQGPEPVTSRLLAKPAG